MMDASEPQDASELRAWRRGERERLLAARNAIDPATIERWRHAIDSRLEATFPALAHSLVGFCWPIQNEYDARHLLARMRRRGARTALPVVIAPRQPLGFRVWQPGVPLVPGVYEIPYPPAGPWVHPEVMVVPMNGFDAGCYRLGYGGGFFDRTLAARRTACAADPSLGRPLVIGVAYECARLATIHPQPYDIPMDAVVTEQAVYQCAPVRPGPSPAAR